MAALLLAFDGAGFLCPGDGKFELLYLLLMYICTYRPDLHMEPTTNYFERESCLLLGCLLHL